MKNQHNRPHPTPTRPNNFNLSGGTLLLEKNNHPVKDSAIVLENHSGFAATGDNFFSASGSDELLAQIKTLSEERNKLILQLAAENGISTDSKYGNKLGGAVKAGDILSKLPKSAQDEVARLNDAINKIGKAFTSSISQEQKAKIAANIKQAKKNRNKRKFAALLTGGLSEIGRKQVKDTKKIIANQKNKKGGAGRFIAALLTGGLSEVWRKQASDTKKLVNKAANKRAAKGKKPLFPKVAKKVFEHNAKLKQATDKALVKIRLTKNSMFIKNKKKVVPMDAPVSATEIKQAVSAVTNEYPQDVQQYANQYPQETAQYYPTPQEVPQYVSQFGQMESAYNQLQNDYPSMYEQMEAQRQQIEQDYPLEAYEEQVVEETDNSQDETPDNQEANSQDTSTDDGGNENSDDGSGTSETQDESSSEMGGGYRGFDSQIGQSIQDNILDISRGGDAYFAFDAADKFFGLTDEEKKAKNKQTWKDVGNALLQNVGNIATTIVNKGNPNYNGAQDGSGAGFDAPPAEKDHTVIYIVVVVSIVGLGLAAWQFNWFGSKKK